MYNDRGICERCRNGKIWNVLLQRCIKQSYLASGVVLVESATHRLMRVYEALDKIVAPSRFYVQKMEEWGIAPEKLIHIPNFLFVPDDADAMPSPAPASYILYFGRLSSEKGLETLIRAAKQAKVSVKVLGSGPQDEYLRAMAAKLEAPVEFCGYQSGDALRAYLDNACVVVLPSEWYENGPMSAVYAFARGKPLIGARIGGIMEMVVEGVTGWGFAAGDVEDLARALSQAEAATRETLEEMGAACRRYFLEKHSPEAYYGAMSALYDELLRR
jgi:glycosyltransferase involved in cell wall biosynthesis